MIRFAALILLLCSCATPQTKDHAEEGQVMNPRRKGDPEPVFQFEPGPAVADTAALKAWLESNRGARLRLPVVIELGEPGHGFKRVRIGALEVRVTDLALGIPLSERIAQKCGREAQRCALWLEGQYGEPFTPPAPGDDRPHYAVVKVGDVVDETAELRAERAK